MDPMDVDPSIEVPDTPDRPKAHGAHERTRANGENHSTSLYSRLHDISNDGSRDHPMFIDSRSRGRVPRPPKHFGSSNISAAPSSSRSTHVLRKGITEKKPAYPTHDSLHNNYQGGFVDLTESNMRRPELGNMTSSLPGRTSFQTAREVMENVSGNGSGNDVRVGNNSQERTGNGVILSHDPHTSPRVCKQKRLVRNGCISPNNVSKAKQLSGKESDSSVASAHNNTNGSNAYSAPPISIDIRELVAEASDCPRARKGKGVMIHPCPSNEPESENKNSQIRSINKDAGKSIEDLDGWRSTRNRNREINLSSPDEDLHVIRGKSPSRYSSQPHESRFGGRERVASVSDGDGINPKSISLEHVHPQSLKESTPHQRNLSTASKLIKRKKHGSTSSTSGQCSTSVFDDQEVVLLSSPAEASYSRSTSVIMDNSNQSIGVGEFSPQLRRNARDEAIRARQLEADELLARELQEQFYSEAPVLEFGELDENIAMALQHQDDSDNVFDQARHPILSERVITPSSRRQSQTRASSSAPRGRGGRRGSFARPATSGRMLRQRNRFPGQARTLLSSRGRASIFPDDMDVETRMHILGALEEFNDMGLNAGIFQDPNGFNENDYEMLLALDDNNDQHSGASARLINGLPQSTVQSENFDEACAVCLDTPTIGDTIRHLPCLHKFHKDCIDPWLRRRTSCPICKSSVN